MLLRGDGAAAPSAAGTGGDAALRGQRSHLRPRLMPEIRGSLPEVGMSSTTLVATASCSSLGMTAVWKSFKPTMPCIHLGAHRMHVC